MSAESGYEPMIVVVRHPDWATIVELHYVEATVVQIDMGSEYDITDLSSGWEIDQALEEAAYLRKRVEHLPADHTGRIDVIEQVEFIEEKVAECRPR